MKPLKMIIEVDERSRIEIDDFNGKMDLAIQFRQPRGEWITTGAAILSTEQARTLAIGIINRLPDAASVLKAKHLSEGNREHAKTARTAARIARRRSQPDTPKTLAELLGTGQQS